MCFVGIWVGVWREGKREKRAANRREHGSGWWDGEEVSLVDDGRLRS